MQNKGKVGTGTDNRSKSPDMESAEKKRLFAGVIAAVSGIVAKKETARFHV